MNLDAAGVLRIAVAAVCGLAVGVERQWSGHATGPRARIGGVRTFTLLGILSGIAGWLWTLSSQALGAVLLSGAVLLIVVAYRAISPKDLEGTTEVAALVTLAAGVLAGLGFLALASGVTAITILLLVEKSRMHDAVSRVDDTEMRAGIRFAVMAVVILPLLPEGPYGPLGGIRPRLLWILVLFFSGMSFVGYIARRAVGARQGYALAGLLGGLVSSTSVTFSFARESKDHPELGRPLALGARAASTGLFLRLVIATGVLNSDLLTTLLPYIVAPFLVGVVGMIVGWKWMGGGKDHPEEPSNPLHLRSALQMAALFQVVLFAVHVAKSQWGASGLVALGAILGLTDMDALTLSMARTAAEPALLGVAAQAIAVGILSNTLFKAAAAAWIGRGAVRILLPLGLAAQAVALAASLILLH